MILTCPSCRARYEVPDNSVGPGGRKVRCAKCRFSLHQEGAEESLAPGEPSVPPRAPAPEPAADEPAPVSPPPPPPPEPEPEPEPEDAGAEEAPPEWLGEDDSAAEQPRRPRRRLWPILAVIAALLIVGTAAALYAFGWSEIAPRLGLAAANEERLAITGRVSREQLPTNTELLTVTGEIRNLTDEVQRVPQIRADLLDAGGQVVYTWPIAPPRAQLQPRETVAFNSATTDVPAGGQSLSLSFAPLT